MALGRGNYEASMGQGGSSYGVCSKKGKRRNFFAKGRGSKDAECWEEENNHLSHLRTPEKEGGFTQRKEALSSLFTHVSLFRSDFF